MASELILGFRQMLTLANWARNKHFNVHGLSRDTIKMRLRAGYSLEAALSLPKRMVRKWRHPDRDVRTIARNHNLTRKQLAVICGRTVEEIRRVLGNG
jgi:hypothetical protein